MRIAKALAAMVLGVLVGTCAACGTAPNPQTPAVPSQHITELERRTVALVKFSFGDPKAYCTGVWVLPDTFLTANHCVRRLSVNETVTYVTRADIGEREDVVGGVRTGALAARDEVHDLALVQDAKAPLHPTSAVVEPFVGQTVETMGHPLGLWWSYSQGQVAAVRLTTFGDALFEDPVWWVQATAPVSPGNSGGGLFDSDGNIVGICNGILPKGENLNLFVHPKYISALLARSK